MFGVMVLALITGLGGGVLRDVLIGAVPPAALDDWRYLVVPSATALVVFVFHPTFGRMEKQIMVLDAIGLSLFCVTGAVKADEAGLGILAASALGLLTGVGGGMMRDVAAGRVPVIFRGELYATPAFAGRSSRRSCMPTATPMVVRLGVRRVPGLAAPRAEAWLDRPAPAGRRPRLTMLVASVLAGEDQLELGVVVAESVVRDRDRLLLEERQRLDPARQGHRSA